MIRYCIDKPAQNTINCDVDFSISGWAISDTKIIHISIYINGDLYDRFETGDERQDVAIVFPDVDDAAHSGFSRNIDINQLSSGQNHVRIAILDHGNDEVNSEIIVNKTENRTDYHQRYILSRINSYNSLSHAVVSEDCHAGALPKVEIWIDCSLTENFKNTIQSVVCQSYKNLHLKLLVNDCGAAMINLLPTDSREKTELVNSIAIELPRDGDVEYVGFLKAGEIMDSRSIEQWVNDIKDEWPDISYSDSDKYGTDGVHLEPNYKPDWSYSYLLSKDYIGGFYLIKKNKESISVINKLVNHSLPAWRYDLLLRLTERGAEVGHVKDVLWSAPIVNKEDDEIIAERNIVEDHLNSIGSRACVVKKEGDIRHIEWSLEGCPKVSIIIPTTGKMKFLVPCLNSILDMTAYPNYELIFLDNGRGEHQEGIDYVASKGIKVINRHEPFNWSRLNNVGASASDGEFFLFLNDDIEITDSNWLEELLRQASRPGIGAVGPLLLYPSGNIQHAGVFLVDHGGGARHWLHHLNPAKNIYQNLNKVVREVSATTGACLMVRRDVFEEVGGFDEELPVVGNDIDFCLRLAQHGYRNIWTPHCCLIHHESVSRKEVPYVDDEKRMWDRWEDHYLAGDSFYNPNLSLFKTDCSLAEIKRGNIHPNEHGGANKTGLNIIGYIKAEMGVGEGARGVAKALTAISHPFCIINYEHGNPSRMGDFSWDHKITDKPLYDINLIHINANLIADVFRKFPSDYFQGKYNIGFWAWELPDFPDEWFSSFSYLDEIWVPSMFVKEAVEKKSPIPVAVIPHPIEKIILPYLGREYFGLPAERFIFLAQYDTHSIQARKNPMGAIDAFKKAFSENDSKVGLVVKVNNPNETELGDLRRYIGDYNNIYIIDMVLDRYQMDSLVASCDCFVSLHRSEGFGLVIAEAMFLGKSVIATNWSGNTDFMDGGNACCVNYQLKELGRDYGPYKSYQYWAEPDIEDAARYMEYLAENPDQSRSLGANAKLSIVDKLSPKVVGGLIKNRIDEIAAR